MQKIKRFWWVGALTIISLPFIAYGAYYCAVVWTWTSAANHHDLMHEWEVELPQNGQLTYRVYSLARMMIGPADSKQTLAWTKQDGSSYEYVLSMGGSYYRDLEFRLRNDHSAVWLVAGKQRHVVAVLNLETGRLDMDGPVIFWNEADYGDYGEGKIPVWATPNNGKSLGRKKFE